jgi:hypothetical protein
LLFPGIKQVLQIVQPLERLFQLLPELFVMGILKGVVWIVLTELNLGIRLNHHPSREIHASLTPRRKSARANIFPFYAEVPDSFTLRLVVRQGVPRL